MYITQKLKAMHRTENKILYLCAVHNLNSTKAHMYTYNIALLATKTV